MDKLKIACILLLTIMLSCSEGKNKEGVSKNGLVFKNDIDQIAGWVSNPSITCGEGHSGKYFCKVDSSIEFSYGFSNFLANISSSKLKKVKFSSWCKSDNMQNKAVLVCSICEEGKSLAWVGVDLKKMIKKPNEWTYIFGDIMIPEKRSPKTEVKVYLWNPKKDVAYADDFEIVFE
jgi:hypothetical protein